MCKCAKSIFIGLLLTGAVLFSSCMSTTTVEPKGEDSCLLVGTLISKTADWDYRISINMNKKFSSGIVITIKDAQTGKSYSVKTRGRSGLFVLGNVEPNHFYRIEDVEVKVEGEGGSWRNVVMDVSGGNFGAMAKAGAVSIMGSFYSEITPDRGDFKDTLKPEDVAFAFYDMYKESSWIDRTFHYKASVLPPLNTLFNENTSKEDVKLMGNVLQDEEPLTDEEIDQLYKDLFE